MFGALVRAAVVVGGLHSELEQKTMAVKDARTLNLIHFPCRGLRVALVEREDFGSGTSSKSTKLVGPLSTSSYACDSYKQQPGLSRRGAISISRFCVKQEFRPVWT